MPYFAALGVFMMKRMFPILEVLSGFFVLTGFTSTSEKAGSTAVVYGVTALLSVSVFLVYIFGVRKKSPWFMLLFISVLIVNIGYFSLAISKTLDEALLANRISYLGSVFLPMSILMIILEVTKTKYGKLLTGFLICVGVIVFLIAASPGYLDIYYKEVSLITVNGVAMLDKVYGPLHILYLFYLLIYFSTMIIFIIVKTFRRKIDSTVQTAVLIFSVFINITVWLLEQFVKIDFEILSVSYVVTEVFLLLLCFLMQESERQTKQVASVAERVKEILTEKADEAVLAEQPAEYDENKAASFFETDEYKTFSYGLGLLTNTERKIYDYYIEGKSTKDILTLLDITENTLKYHNKNIYGKLGVSSRKQLKEIAYKIINVNNP